jgi:hypothetical protein
MTINSDSDSKKNISEILTSKRKALIESANIALNHLKSDQKKMEEYLTIISERVNSRLMDSLTSMIIEQYNDIYICCTYDTLHFIISNYLELVAKLQDEGKINLVDKTTH